MSASELKEKLHRYIDGASDEELEKLNAYVEDDIVTYTIEGEPIMAEEFKKEAEGILQRMEAGEYTKIQDLKKEMKMCN